MKAAWIAAGATLAVVVLVAAGCSGGGGGTVSDLRSYMPMADGNTWTYDLRIRADLWVPTQVHPGWNSFVQTETITGTAVLLGTSYSVFQATRLANADYPELVYSPQ